MKFMNIIKIILIFFATIILLFLFLSSIVNKENLSYKTKLPFLSGTNIIEEKNCVLIITSSWCPGNKETMPILEKTIKKLNKDSIKYFIVSDEIYNVGLDDSLDVFFKKYNIDSKYYLMDIKKYPKNGGLLNNKKRYINFMKDICNDCNDCLFGYVNYSLIKDGKYIKSVLYIKDQDLKYFNEK